MATEPSQNKRAIFSAGEYIPPRLHVKICGLTRAADAVAAAAAGADLLGMIFYPPSPRGISLPQAREIVRAVREAGFTHVRLVAVTVNAPRHLLERLLNEVGVDLIQLHGDEPPVILEALRGRGYKALRPHTPEELALDAPWYLDLGPREGPRLLVDAAVKGAYGGTGHLANWDAARRLARRYPILLAGGLTPDNVADAVRAVRPWGVDTSSGVEAAPGQKDISRVREFIAAARAAWEEIRHAPPD